MKIFYTPAKARMLLGIVGIALDRSAFLFAARATRTGRLAA